MTHRFLPAVRSARSRSSETNLVRRRQSRSRQRNSRHRPFPRMIPFYVRFSLSLSFSPKDAHDIGVERSAGWRRSDKGPRHIHPSCTGRLFIPGVKSVAAEAVWTSRCTKSTNFGHRLLAQCIRAATAAAASCDR